MMKDFYVQLPMAGIISFDVEAETEEEAIEKALCSDKLKIENIDEWDVFEHICEGNVCYAPLLDVIAYEE